MPAPPVPVNALRVLLAGPAQGGTIILAQDVTIGREGRPGGLSFEDDSEMSRRHARFRPLASGSVLVEDLGSSNGTEVNGRRIDIPRLLAIGDEIRIGGTTFRLERLTEAPTAGVRAPARAPTLVRATGGPGAGDPLATLPAPPPTRAGIASVDGPSDHRGRPGRSRDRVGLATLVVVVVLLAVAAVAFAATRHQRPAPPSARQTGTGTVYLESGASQPGANAVLAYRYRAGGDLQPLEISTFPTGGSAGFDLTNTGALDADGQIVTSADGRLLFAVNQGSDTIAVFHVLGDGSLEAVAGSPFRSGGAAPGGLGLAGNRLVAVNKAQDGVRDLSLVAPNVTTFLVQPDGSLRPTGSVVALPAGTSPTEALISPDGKVVVVPEEHGPLLSLTLDHEGKLAQAVGSPYPLPDAIFPAGLPRSQRWALGLGAHPNGTVLYGQVVDTAQLVVYQYDGVGRLHFVRAVADPGASLPCWSLVNGAGTRLYTDNAGNNTMSVFDLSDPLNPRQLQVVTLRNAGNPWDLRMDPSGRFIYVLDPRDRQDLVPAGGGNELHTLVVNPDGTLTEAADSPVAIPVPLNTNPIGLAVVGH